jgi:LuxR family transcriptional regulator
MKFRDYLQFVTTARSLEELWPAHVEQMSRFGFDRLIYGSTKFQSKTSLGDPEDFVVLTNHRGSYVNDFIYDGLYFDAPMVQWALKNDGACSWRFARDMLADQKLSKRAQQILEYNAQLDMTSGYTVSFPTSSQRVKGAIALAARPGLDQDAIDEVWSEHGTDIILMNNVAHLKILSMPYVPPNRSLTSRQREVLAWVGDGKTTQDISTILGLTTATVDKHLRLAREALSVETTAQAVLKASLHNQIFLPTT